MCWTSQDGGHEAPPEVRGAVQKAPIYRSSWQPIWEATVHEGEAIVFFPNLFHETHVPEDNPECTVATTFQIQLPVPARYLRAYLPTFSYSHLYYEGHCLDLWHPYATLRPPQAILK
eukprot:Skav205574  [mRNA]  locus=scaffold460:12561:14749:+ [translate_table: standard]